MDAEAVMSSARTSPADTHTDSTEDIELVVYIYHVK